MATKPAKEHDRHTGPRKGAQAELDRSSRTGTRGLPKKNGAGGKGTWGKPGDPTTDLEGSLDCPGMEEEGAMDAEQERALRAASKASKEAEEMDSSTGAIKRVHSVLDTIIKEYFTSGDAAEVERSLREVADDEILAAAEVDGLVAFVVRLITSAMSHKGRERELASEALVKVYEVLISPAKVEAAFRRLVSEVDDTALDVPDAPDLLGRFIARAQLDEILPPSFLGHAVEWLSSQDSLGARAVRLATSLLKMKHAGVRIEHQWGFSTEEQSVTDIKRKMQELLEELLDSGDAAEAERCVQELDALHYMHELLKKGIILGIERTHKDRLMIHDFFKLLGKNKDVSADQFVLGFQRVLDRIDDVKLDNPNAYKVFMEQVALATRDAYLPIDWCL